jgi:DNA-binding transcriptional LysR family regulator
MLKLGASPWTPMVAAARAGKLAPVKRWDDVAWIAWGDDLASIPPARWLTKHAPRVEPVLRTSHIATQVAAVEAGLGVALLPASYARVSGVAPLRYGKALEPSAAELPLNETWLVGHRALRGVPRIAAVWDFLVDEFQRSDGARRRPHPGPPPQEQGRVSTRR